MLSWFVLKSGTVVGPISSDQVLSSYNNSTNMVWGVNCSEWLSFSEWSNQLSSGVFDVEVKTNYIPLKPKLKDEKVEAKVFKIRPSDSEATVVEQDIVPLLKAKDSEKKPLPSIPNVDDIFRNDPVVVATETASVVSDSASNSDLFQDPEVSDIKLNEQLTDFLQESFIDNDGHTLIQATMDDLSHELELEEKVTVDDASVGSADSSTDALTDGLTKVQSLDLDDGFTKVQGLETEIEDSAANLNSINEPTDFFNMSDVENGSNPNIEVVNEFSLDIGSSSDTSSSEANNEFFSLEDASVSDSEKTIVESDVAQLSESFQSSAELSVEPAADTSEVTILELDSRYLEEESATKIQSVADLSEAFSSANTTEVSEVISVELEADKNLNSRITDMIDLNEKTNISDLKEFAQNIEQQKILEKPIWYVAYDGESEGPMNVEALLKKLDSYSNPDYVYLWKQGMQDWQNLYDTPQISSQLGIGFRRHDRYPFSGTVKIEFKGNTQIGQLENLSISGLGATGFGPLVLGEIVKVTLDCSALEAEIEFVAEIRFTSDLGVLGLAYVKTQFTENVNKVIELVKSQSAQKAA